MDRTAVAARPRMAWMMWIPGLVLAGLGVLGAAGVSLTPSATAVNPTNVNVNATVTAGVDISAACGAQSIAVALGSIAYSGQCNVDYGATNDATTKLTIEDQNGTPFQGTIANTASSCAALAAADEAGVHIVGTATNSAITAAWAGGGCTTAAVLGSNTNFTRTPPLGSPADACQSSLTIGTNHRCSFEWAVREAGSDLAPGTYNGVAVFTAVDI